MRVAIGLLSLVVACTSQPLDDAFDAAADMPDLASLSVRQDGAVVREAYYHGSNAGTAHDVRSVTKTVTSLLIGIAIDTGCLASVDQTLGELLGDLAPGDPAKAAITVRHLLTMTSGLDWAEVGAVGYNDWVTADDQVQYVLARPLAAAPGTEFNYNSGALHLLSVILTRACAPTAEFAAQHLFAPLGIASRPWEIDNQGITNGAAGLRVTTPEMASIGELLLAHGQRGGAPVVSADYVDMALAPQIGTGYAAESYGYGIWLEDGVADGPIALAEGYGGQFIVVVPAASAVIVATTNWQGRGAQATTRNFHALLALIVTKIVPAL